MKRTVLKTIFFLLSLSVVGRAAAQSLIDYTLVYDNSTFQTIVGTDGAQKLAAVSGDNSFDYTTLPFSFPFGEARIEVGTRVNISSNGYLFFGSVNPGDYVASVWGNSGLSYRIIAPAVLGDGYCTTTAENQGAWYTYTEDAAGDSTLVFEVRGVSPYQVRDNSEYLNYQISLYPSGTIVIHFDESLFTHTSNINTMLANGYGDKVCLTGSWSEPTLGQPSSIPSMSTAPAAGSRYVYSRPEGFCNKPQNLLADQPTASSIHLSWSGEAVDYTLYWAPSGSDWSDSITTDGATEYTVYDLSSSSSYTFAVRSLCEDGQQSNLSASVTLFTSCAPLTSDDLPFRETFEGMATSDWNPCWTRWYKDDSGNLSSGYSPYSSFIIPTTTDGTSGTNSLRLQVTPYHSASIDHKWCIIAMPQVEADFSDITLSFSKKFSKDSNNVLIMGFMSDPTDTATFVPFDTIPANNTVWDTATISLADYNGVGTYPALLFYTSTSSGWDTYYAYIDDVTLTGSDICSQPQGITIGEVTSTYASLTIVDDNPASYEVSIWHEDSDTTTTTQSSLDLFFNLLQPATHYHVEVVKICSNGTRAFSISSQFLTPCEPFSHVDLPLQENFDSYSSCQGGFVNPCWTIHNFNNNGTYPYPTSYTRHGSTGNSLMFYASTTQENQVVAMPVVDYLNDLTLRFYSYATSAYNRLEVGYMTDPSDTATFVLLRTIQPTEDETSQWILNEIDLAEVQGDNIALAFRHTHTSSATGYSYCIDDLELGLTPSCHQPDSLSFYDITPTSFTLTIHDSSAVNHYVVSIGDEEVIVRDFNEVTIDDRTPGTTYNILVVAVCESGDTTQAVSASVTLPCMAVAEEQLPWNENFDTWATGNYAPFPSCWQRYYGRTGNWSEYTESRVKATDLNGRRMLYMYGAGGYSNAYQDAYVVLPEFDVELARLEITAVLHFQSSVSDSNDFFQIGVMASADQPDTFEPLYTHNNDGSQGFDTVVARLNHTTLEHGVVAVRYAYRVSGDYYYAYIDSIAARINDEPEPEPEPVAIDSPESSLDAVVIAPNPATTTATISGIQHACQIAVIDQNGRSMMTMQHDASASPLSINVSTLPKGIYYVRISSSSAAVTRKLIVR